MKYVEVEGEYEGVDGDDTGLLALEVSDGRGIEVFIGVEMTVAELFRR